MGHRPPVDLALKIYHMREQAERERCTDEHRQRCQHK
jgi:hypothetical protein